MSKFAVIGPLYSIVLTGVSYLSSSLISLLFIFPGTPRPYISYTREKEKVTHYIEMNEVKSTFNCHFGLLSDYPFFNDLF